MSGDGFSNLGGGYYGPTNDDWFNTTNEKLSKSQGETDSDNLENQDNLPAADDGTLTDASDQRNDAKHVAADADMSPAQGNTDPCRNGDSEAVFSENCKNENSGEEETIPPTGDNSQDQTVSASESNPPLPQQEQNTVLPAEGKVNHSACSPVAAASLDIKYQDNKFIVSISEDLIRDFLPKPEKQQPMLIELKEEKTSEPEYPVKKISPARKLRIPSIEELTDFLKNGKAEWAFSPRTEEDIFIFADSPTCDTWFISDIHGDMLALERCILHIDEQTPEANIIFLGDIFDRGPDSMNCTAALLGLIKDRPGKILWLAGNHDTGLKWSDEKQEFRGAVDPAEFTDFLNADKEKYAEFGQELIKFIKKLPYALFFSDGLIAVHGGVPFNDRRSKPLDEVLKIGQLAESGMKERFIWARFSTAKAKIYLKKDSDYGYDNFAGFCTKMHDLTNINYSRIICGHQHFPGFSKLNHYPEHLNEQGISIYSSYRRDMWGNNEECVDAVIAKYRKGAIPEVHLLQESVEKARKYFMPKGLPLVQS